MASGRLGDRGENVTSLAEEDCGCAIVHVTVPITTVRIVKGLIPILKNVALNLVQVRHDGLLTTKRYQHFAIICIIHMDFHFQKLLC